MKSHKVTASQRTHQTHFAPYNPKKLEATFKANIPSIVQKWADDSLLPRAKTQALQSLLEDRWNHTEGKPHKEKFLTALSDLLYKLAYDQDSLTLVQYDDRKTEFAAIEFRSEGKPYSAFIRGTRAYGPGAKLTISLRGYDHEPTMSLSPRYKEIRIGSDIGERPPHLDITDVKYVNGRQKQFDNWSGNHADVTRIWKDHKEMTNFVSLFFEKYIDTFFEDQKPYAPVTSVLGA